MDDGRQVMAKAHMVFRPGELKTSNLTEIEQQPP